MGRKDGEGDHDDHKVLRGDGAGHAGVKLLLSLSLVCSPICLCFCVFPSMIINHGDCQVLLCGVFGTAQRCLFRGLARKTRMSAGTSIFAPSLSLSSLPPQSSFLSFYPSVNLSCVFIPARAVSQKALHMVEQQPYNLVLCDLQMPGEAEGGQGGAVRTKINSTIDDCDVRPAMVRGSQAYDEDTKYYCSLHASLSALDVLHA